MAGTTRLELATSAVTGQRSNQTELRPHYGHTERLDSKLIPFANRIEFNRKTPGGGGPEAKVYRRKSAGLNRLLKNSESAAKVKKRAQQGLQGRSDSAMFVARLKPCPYYKTL